jgi:hypothetical protein
MMEAPCCEQQGIFFAWNSVLSDMLANAVPIVSVMAMLQRHVYEPLINLFMLA